MKENKLGVIKEKGQLAIEQKKGQFVIYSKSPGIFANGILKLIKMDSHFAGRISHLTPKIDTLGCLFRSNPINFSESGDIMAIPSFSTKYFVEVFFYNTTTSASSVFRVLEAPLGVNGCGSVRATLSPKGKYAVVVSVNEPAILVNIDKKVYYTDITLPGATAYAWSPNGKVLASVIDNFKLKGEKNTIRLVSFLFFSKGVDEAISLPIIKQYRYEDYGTLFFYEKGNLPLDFSKDSRFLFAGGGTKDRGVIQIFDVEREGLLAQRPESTSEINCLKCSDDGNHLISCNRNGSVTIWQIMKTGSQLLEEIESIKVDGSVLDIGCDTLNNGIYIAYENKAGVVVSRIEK